MEITKNLQQAFRRLRKLKFFTAVAVITLGLGIGSSISIFSIVDALLLRSLPYPDPGRLVLLWGNYARTGSIERRGASYPDLNDWRQQSKSFEGMASFSAEDWKIRSGETSEIVPGEIVSSSYFSLLGIKPVLGRVFTLAEDQNSDNSLAVVLGHRIWTRTFGSDPGIIGKSIQLADRPAVVIGVLPPEFRGLTDEAEVWTSTAFVDRATMTNRALHSFPVVARLKPGISVKEAQNEMRIVAQRLASAYPATNDHRGTEVIGLKEDTVRSMRSSVLFSFAAVIAVLLIACINVSNLMLVRAEGREKEIALRYALGATRMHTLQLALTESGLLASGGLLLGIVVAYWATPTILLFNPIPLPGYAHVNLDFTVLAFSAAITAVAALLVGILPVLRFWKSDLNSALSARTVAAGPRQRLRGALVVSEVALVTVLLVGAGLLILTFQKLIALDPGFKANDILTLHLKLPAGQDVDVANQSMALLQRVQAVPGVLNASLSSDVPLDGHASASFYTSSQDIAESAQKRPRAFLHRVTPDFFSTFGIRLVAGRWFTATDMASNRPFVVISKDVVKRSWPSVNPIGQRLQMGSGATTTWYEVIGIVDNVMYRGIPGAFPDNSDVYLPLSAPVEEMAMAVRSERAADLVKTLTATIKSFEATTTIYDVATMKERTSDQLSIPRFAGLVMGVFAGIAFILAFVGIYSVMSYLVFQRTQEIGIRLALGARPSSIFLNVISRGLWMGITGTLIGAACILAMHKLVASLLFGISAVSPLIIGLVSSLMLVCVVLACYMPAHSATKVDPSVTLRHEC
ncbi:MAG TPA: ABC transporter permease [Candidatus Angelobacter sp.]